MCDMGISKRMYGFDMSLSFIVSYSRLGREYYNIYYYYYSTTTNNRVKIHSFLTSKKLLRTQESESASIEPSNICMC